MFICEYGIPSFIVDQYGYGTYKIKVDATWVYGTVNGSTVNGPEIVIEYNITAPSYQFASATPASNEKVNSLSEILINYNTNSVLTSLTGSVEVEVEVEGAVGVTATLEPTSVAGQIKATLSQAVTAEGSYSITVPEGTFTIADGSVNEEDRKSVV